MSRLLTDVLSRWEIDPPAFCASEAGRSQAGVGCVARARRFAAHHVPRAWTCTECGQRCSVDYLADPAGGMHGYIHCRDCGVGEVPRDALARWSIDTAVLLSRIFRHINVSVRQRASHHLWQVGKANWAGRSREVWFARAFRRHAVAAAIEELAKRPKAILFAPTEMGAGRWRDAAGNLTIALESALSLEEDSLVLDADYVESRIIDAGLAPGSAAGRRTKKRADRAANIERLRTEMIEHLRAPAIMPLPRRKVRASRPCCPGPLKRRWASKSACRNPMSVGA